MNCIRFGNKKIIPVMGDHSNRNKKRSAPDFLETHNALYSAIRIEENIFFAASGSSPSIRSASLQAYLIAERTVEPTRFYPKTIHQAGRGLEYGYNIVLICQYGLVSG